MSLPPGSPEHSVTAAEGTCLAVDIGGTTTRVAVVQGSAVTHRHEAATPASQGPQAVLDQVLSLLNQCHAPPYVPLAVACTGRVHQGCVTAINQATMPGWTAVPVEGLLSRATGRPVTVLNDAKAATLAEWQASGKPDHFMFLTISTGIGSGLVLRGRLVQAPEGLDIGLGFARGPEGQALEVTSSGRGLEQAAGPLGSVRALFDAAEQGDVHAQTLLTAPFQILADRIHDAHCLLGLNLVSLGGSLGLRDWTHFVLNAALPDLRLTRAAHGADAGLLGVALHARTIRQEMTA
nr:ROK family protein [Deinococcus deserti]